MHRFSRRRLSFLSPGTDSWLYSRVFSQRRFVLKVLEEALEEVAVEGVFEYCERFKLELSELVVVVAVVRTRRALYSIASPHEIRTFVQACGSSSRILWNGATISRSFGLTFL